MNKYTYTSLVVLLQTFGLATVTHGADLKYDQKTSVKILQNEDIVLGDFLNFNKDDVTINNLINLIKNDNSSLSKNLNPSSNLTKCSIIPRVDNPRQQENRSIRFLPQTQNNDILKGVYDYDQIDTCKPDQDNQIIGRIIDSPQSQQKNNQEDNFKFKQISLLDYQQTNTEFKPIEPSYTYLQTAQVLNTRTNSNPQSFNYKSNYQSLSLINSIAIKPISIVTNPTGNNLKNNQVVSNQSIFAQPGNPQNNLDYLNASSGQQAGIYSINTNPVPTYQSQVPSSPILDKIKQEMDKQQQQMQRKLQQDRRRIEQQEQRRKQQQQRQEQQKKRQQEREQKRIKQQLIQQQKQLQQQQNNLLQRR